MVPDFSRKSAVSKTVKKEENLNTEQLCTALKFYIISTYCQLSKSNMIKILSNYGR